MTTSKNDVDRLWPLPEGIEGAGREAAERLREFIGEHELADHGGGEGHQLLYTRQQWVDRGEEYGLGAVLIVTHDGGVHAPAFDHSYGSYDLREALRHWMTQHGFWIEQCTSWYSAVYREDN